MLRRQRIIFFVVIGFAILISLGALLAERLGIFTLPSRTVTPVPIQVVVPTELSDWAENAARKFENRNGDAQITIVTATGLNAIDQFAQADADALPQAWIPEASFVMAIAQDRGISFGESGRTVAQTDLAWGAFNSRMEALGEVNWQTVHNGATATGWSELNGDANWGYFKLTIASPTRSTEGVAALLSAAAAYYEHPNITRTDVTNAQFLDWLQTTVESVPNFNTLGPAPAESMATRGPSLGDVGLLSAAAWQRSLDGLNGWESFILVEPQYSVRLNYPYLLRNNLDSDEREMAERFGDYLLDQTDELSTFGFDEQATGSAPQVEAEPQAILALLRWAERERFGQ